MGPIRLLLRIVATVSLAAAVILAVVDATRSLAQNALVTTPLAVTWEAMSPATLAGLQRNLSGAMDALWDPVVVSILALPGFVVFAALAFVFFILGRHPRRRVVPLRS